MTKNKNSKLEPLTCNDCGRHFNDFCLVCYLTPGCPDQSSRNALATFADQKS